MVFSLFSAASFNTNDFVVFYYLEVDKMSSKTPKQFELIEVRNSNTS